jgi:outer membrane protein assembly factor BamA
MRPRRVAARFLPTYRARVLARIVTALLLISGFWSVAPAKASEDAPADSVALRDIADLFRALIGRPVRTDVEKELKPGLSLTILPSIGYNPSYGAFVGASVAIGGWLGSPATTNLSSGSAGASYSTTEQISVQFKSDFYLSDNAWALKGDWRYLDTSQPTFGLGSAHPGQSSYPMEFVLYRLHETALKRVKTSPVYVGLGYHFDRYDQIHDERAEAGESTPYSIYSGGQPSRSQSSAVSGNVLVDTRDNAINASRGLFWNASLRFDLREIGSDEDRQTVWSDFRTYVKLPRGRDVLAIWNYYWFTFGRAPYLDLPAIGWDTYGRSGRGYLQGRIRSANLVYLESEYRRRFTRDDMWGGVAFVNMMASTNSSGGPFGKPDYGFGLGIRLKFNKRTNTNLSVDAARGQDDTTRFFFGLQEVF